MQTASQELVSRCLGRVVGAGLDATMLHSSSASKEACSESLIHQLKHASVSSDVKREVGETSAAVTHVEVKAEAGDAPSPSKEAITVQNDAADACQGTAQQSDSSQETMTVQRDTSKEAMAVRNDAADTCQGTTQQLDTDVDMQPNTVNLIPADTDVQHGTDVDMLSNTVMTATSTASNFAVSSHKPLDIAMAIPSIPKMVGQDMSGHHHECENTELPSVDAEARRSLIWFSRPPLPDEDDEVLTTSQQLLEEVDELLEEERFLSYEIVEPAELEALLTTQWSLRAVEALGPVVAVSDLNKLIQEAQVPRSSISLQLLECIKGRLRPTEQWIAKASSAMKSKEVRLFGPQSTIFALILE